MQRLIGPLRTWVEPCFVIRREDDDGLHILKGLLDKVAGVGGRGRSSGEQFLPLTRSQPQGPENLEHRRRELCISAMDHGDMTRIHRLNGGLPGRA